jgi:ABC-2 type transport system permease protein
VIDRLTTLIGKELREFRAHPSAILPVAIVVIVTLAVPFVLVVMVPRLTGEDLGADPTVRKAVVFASDYMPALATLPPASAVQAFLFQQFLMLFLMAPIVGAVTLAAYSIVGEKQQRTLEPLLTTPLTTAEIVLGKVIAAMLPSLAIELVGVCIYFGLVALFADPGVFAVVAGARSAVLLLLIGPLASLVALQGTIAISARVNDPRSAQQIAVLLVLPLVAMLVGQIVGAFVVTTAMLVGVAAGLAVVWGFLILLSVALFERETILTRWK